MIQAHRYDLLWLSTVGRRQGDIGRRDSVARYLGEDRVCDGNRSAERLSGVGIDELAARRRVARPLGDRISDSHASRVVAAEFEDPEEKYQEYWDG